MEQREMLNVIVGFKKDDVEYVRQHFLLSDEIILKLSELTPQYILLASEKKPKNVPWHYVECRIEARTLMSAAVAGCAGEQLEILRLFAMPGPALSPFS